MEYTYFPKTNLEVSRLCLGTMMFGGQTEEQDAIRIMDEALDLGVNFFDTANVYNGGVTEEVVGRWLKNHRDQVILASKVGIDMGQGLYDTGLSRGTILKQVDASLARLQTDYIDIYYMHKPDYHTDFFETMQTLDTLVKQGKIRYIGVSNHAAWQMADILHVCEKYGFNAPVVTQNVLNPVTRGIEAELLPFLKAHPMALCIYNPLAAGLLTGKYTNGNMPEHTRFSMNPRYKARYYSEDNLRAADELEKIAKECGLSLLQLALCWSNRYADVTSVICGVSRPEQLRGNVEAMQLPALPAYILEKCDAIYKRLPVDRFAYNR